ncbi:hypothetical protein M422DRAFT_39043 [Sphaerobolus stellatus SS14]|uniref:Unplaced genomic scaffold SPHSTscaffold_389, whole genome shotgun sequence n=1 Tax=Sphaerobolus stellatus (strain SS14) TaxID=990650 RepID=A0A0C9T6X2_SPHS4|nr:hypothetical protein M422DRAFT_39043 [Sphaerobolus stellatus SS14]
MILYGALVVQSFLYYQTYRKDAKWMRYFVLYLVVMETINVAFDMYLIYEPLIQRYGTQRAVTVTPLALNPDALVTVLISVPVQLFTTWRIKVLNGSNVTPGFIVFFAICSFGGATATTISVSIVREFAKAHQFDSVIIIWLASSSLADIIITSTLVWSLRSRKTGLSETDNVVNRIIVLTIQTGAITALFALLDFVLFLAIPNSTANFLVDFPLSKLYSNSLISTLNARAGWSNTLKGRKLQDNVLFGPGSPSGPSPNNSRDLYSHQRRSIVFTSTNIELRVPIATTTIDTIDIDIILPVDLKTPPDLEAAMGTTPDHMSDGERDLGVRRVVDHL